MLEIRDWLVAREVDIAAEEWLYGEEIKREQRDREFWVTLWGYLGIDVKLQNRTASSGETILGEDLTLEDHLERSALNVDKSRVEHW